jgi:hypothetical protein
MSNVCLQLWFEGLKVENVEVSKMYTYMENFEFSVGSTVYVAKEEDIFGVNMHVRQQRLNHKQFTYKIEVSSEKAVDAYVRVFLAPKTNYLGEEWDLNERRHYFVELDRFPYHGTFNNIQKQSAMWFPGLLHRVDLYTVISVSGQSVPPKG